MAAAPLAVLGATGYTGGLVVERARELGLPLRLVGRRRDALEAMAVAGDEIRVADARDDRALREAFDGAFAVASLAGPFLAVGDLPVAAAIDRRAHAHRRVPFRGADGRRMERHRAADRPAAHPDATGEVVRARSEGCGKDGADRAARRTADPADGTGRRRAVRRAPEADAVRRR